MADRPQLMPKEEPGWLKRFNQINETSGGSSVARGYNEGQMVSFTQFGEFAARTTEEGEFIADFVDLGVICIYSPEGRLSYINLEISTLLSNLTEDDLNKMVNDGVDIMGFIEDLENHNEELFLGVYPLTGEVAVNLESEMGSVSRQEDYCDDFSKGFGGDITLGEYTICYHVISYGDEFRLSIGERKDEVRTLMPVLVSHQINLKKFYNSKEAGRHLDLAKAIMLNP